MNTNNLYFRICFPNLRIRGAWWMCVPAQGRETNGSDTPRIVRALGDEGKYLSTLGVLSTANFMAAPGGSDLNDRGDAANSPEEATR